MIYCDFIMLLFELGLNEYIIKENKVNFLKYFINQMIYISLFYILKVLINKQIEINCNSFFPHDANIANSGLIQRRNICLYKVKI